MKIAGCICFIHKSYILHKQRLDFASLSPADFLDTKKVCSHNVYCLFPFGNRSILVSNTSR